MTVTPGSFRPVALALVLALLPAALQAAPPRQRGIALGLFAEDPGFDYGPLLQEIAQTGASHVSIVVPYYQHNLRSTVIGRHPRFSPPHAVVAQTLRQARQQGLAVMLFPIVRLEYALTNKEWRGSLAPLDPQAWWRSYRTLLLEQATLARDEQVEALCVGSELGTLDGDPTPWVPLIAAVRRVFSGTLVYSANWDRFDKVGLWPLVDRMGLSAYDQLVGDFEPPPSLPRLIHAWREIRARVSRARARGGKPLIITEVGYHSQRGTSAFPWDEAADRPLGLDEQARCYQAFTRVWDQVPYLDGVFFWTWFGYGGPKSREYTPRGKPAAKVLCGWYGGKTCPTRFGLVSP